MAQVKEQIKTPEKELNEMDISNLLDAEYKALVIKMLKKLSGDLSSIRNIQSEMKDPFIKIKFAFTCLVPEIKLWFNYL